MKNSTFAERLVQAMKDADMSSAELCRRCSISKSTLSQYRSGLYEAKYDRIVHIAGVLGCSPGWLSGNDVPMNTVVCDGTAVGMVPVLSRIALDGDSLFAPENISGYEMVEECFSSEHHFMVTASGDSMEPVIADGDRLLCLRQDTLKPGQLAVFLLPGGSWVIRRLDDSNGVLTLSSFNHYYPPRSLDAFGEVRVVGRVIRSTRYW